MRASLRSLATASAALVALGGLVFAGVAGGAPDPGSSINVTFEATTPQSADCATKDEALSMSKGDNGATYSFVFTLSDDLCTPIEAKAVAYRMPQSGGSWPQELGEVKTFTLADAGITTVTFDKECIRTQFDVLTGATPQRINWLGPHHGPLVMFNFLDFVDWTESAHQYGNLPERCIDSTTTVPDTSETTSSTSEPPVTVEPATTIREATGPGGESDSSVPGAPSPTVEAADVSRAPAALSVTG